MVVIGQWIKAIPKGKVVIPLDTQSYQGAVECFILPMSLQFDIILGEDWCTQTSCEISYKSCSVNCNDINGRSHTLLTQATNTATYVRLSVLFILKALVNMMICCI